MNLQTITGFVQNLPFIIILSVSAGLIIIAALAVWFLLSRRRFYRQLEKAELWVERFYARPSRRKLRRILEYTPDTGLFTAFRVALEKKAIADELLSRLEQSDDMFVYRQLALSGKGEDFDGKKGYELFASRIDRIREMTGDPEWPARYMALKIILHDGDERSKRTIREMFHDPHTLVRRTLIDEFVPEPDKEKDEFYAQLLSYLTDDPAFEVRAAAKRRLAADYADRYEIVFTSLTPEQSLHVIEQLDPHSPEDVNLALSFLEGKNLELRFTAAQFLERSGKLEEMLADVQFEDRKQLERNLKLLRNAAEVNVLEFLQSVQKNTNPASLYCALDILCTKGDTGLLDICTRRVFGIKITAPEERKLLELALQCISKRGTPDTVKRMIQELLDRRAEREQAVLFLEHIPNTYPRQSVPGLMELLKDPAFEEQEKLHEAFARIDPSFYLNDLFAILKGGREQYPHPVRISALLLLGRLKLTYCMQFLLEQMPVLPFKEARDFSVHLHDYAGKLFTDRVLSMIGKDDGKVRAALITAVPATGIKEFLKPIREAVDDADPEVRRASVWALLEYGDQRSIKGSLDLLRDPVDRVRIEAARALASQGSSAVLDSFSDILLDDNEVTSVKTAAVDGLGRSGIPKSTDILASYLKNRPEELPEAVMNALARKTDPKQLKKLIEQLKDAAPELRDAITESFRRMGEQAEKPLVELLREEISSLMPHISYILEQTGFVEHMVRKLNHRDPEVRKEAAEVLSLIGTTAAFRGIVLASRDPNDDVRVMVTKALEKLGSKSGKEILEELKNDPDKRIRKYTLWALERIQAKSTG